jgi:hypothetical protein
MKKKLFMVILVVVLFTVTGCFNFEKSKLEKRAINYFVEKYNIDKNDIDVTKNTLYGKDRTCIDDCGDNELIINYKGGKYKIKHNPYTEFYGDNYQYNDIYNGLVNYLNDKFPFTNKITVKFVEYDIVSVPVKYNGDIKYYYEEVKAFENNHRYISDNISYIPRDLSTWVNVWIKAETKEEAKSLNTKYSKIITDELNSLGVSYNLAISLNSNDNDYSAFYYYHAYSNQCYFTDRVDNQKSKCDR